MRFGYLLVLLVLLAGCGAQQVHEVRSWASEHHAKAKNGEIKWSDYYKGLYLKLADAPAVSGRADRMEWANMLISASTLYEAGRIDKEQFESMQRVVAVAEARSSEQSSDAARQTWARALQNAGASYGNSANQIRQQQMQNRPIQCSTYQGMTTCY